MTYQRFIGHCTGQEWALKVENKGEKTFFTDIILSVIVNLA